MSHRPSMREPEMNHKNATEESCMELSTKQELIRRLKEAKEDGEFTYQRIMEKMADNGDYTSLSTLKRALGKDAEKIAESFSLENTLLPIAKVLLKIEDIPTDPDLPCAPEIEKLKAVIHAQNAEIERLHELKDHLENRIEFLIGQIELKDKRMDQKDTIIQKLMEKYI